LAALSLLRADIHTNRINAKDGTMPGIGKNAQLEGGFLA
jgi:hypothetical protein